MHKLLSSLLLAGLLSSAQSATAQTTFTLNFAKGSSLKYETISNTKMSVKGMDMANNLNASNTMLFQSMGDSAGQTTINYAILRNAMNMEGVGAGMNINSDNPITDSTSKTGILSKLYKEMTNYTFTLYLNKKGEVVQEKGFKEWVKDHKKLQADLKEIMGTQMNMIDMNMFKQSYSTLFSILPDKPVKVGGKWKKRSTVSTNGISMNYDNTYILDSIDEHKAVIKVTSDIYAHSTVESMPDVSVNIMGDSKGVIWLDVKTGMVIKRTADTHIESKPEVKGGTGMGMDIPTSILESTSSIEAK